MLTYKTFLTSCLAILLLAGCSAAEFKTKEQKQDNKSDEPLVTQQEATRNNAVIKLDVYIDYQDPFSKRFYLTLNELLEKYENQLEVVYKQYPLSSIHPDAETAAHTALCSAQQGKFLEMNDMLLRTDPDKLSLEHLRQYAQDAGIQLEPFTRCVENAVYQDQIDNDQASIESLNIGIGVPSTIIDNRFAFRGAVQFAVLDAVVNNLIQQKLPDQTVANTIVFLNTTQQQDYKRAKATQQAIDTTQKKSLLPSTTSDTTSGQRPEDAKEMQTTIDWSQFEVPIESWRQAGIVHFDVYVDYQDNYSDQLYQTLLQIKNKYGSKVEVYYKYYPLTKLHPDAQMATFAALCAADQGKFLEMHDTLLRADSDKISSIHLEQYAQKLNLELDQFRNCITSSKYQERLTRDKYELELLHSTATGEPTGGLGVPTTIMNGELKISGAQSFDTFDTLIMQYLQQGYVEVPRTHSLVDLTAQQKQAYRALQYLKQLPAGVHRNPIWEPQDSVANAPLDPYTGPRYEIPDSILPQYTLNQNANNVAITMVTYEFKGPSINMYDTLLQLARQYSNDVSLNIRFIKPSGIFETEDKLNIAGAYCAGEDGRFWEYADALFHKKILSSTNNNHLEYLKQVGATLNLSNNFNSCLEQKRYESLLEQEFTTIPTEFTLSNSPVTFINGRRILGSYPSSMIKSIIEQEILNQ